MSGDVAVGVDGSAESFAAVDWAAGEAAGRDGRLRLVSATRWEKHPNVVMPSYAAEDWGRSWLEEAEQRVLRRHPQVVVTFREDEDAPVKVLLAAAEGASLLVLGSRALSEAGSFLLGSVGLASVAQAEVPVVLVRPGEGRAGAQGEIVLGMDARRPSDELLEFAFGEAVRRSAELRIVHTWHFPAAYRRGADEEGRGVHQEAEGALSEAVEPWRRRFPRVPVTTEVVRGRAAAHLVSSGDGAALLVVGRRREKGRAGHHVGAVTHAVVHHAPCPVAVVPHG